MALSCINSKIKRDIGTKSWFFHTPLQSTPPLGGHRCNIYIPFGTVKLEWWGYPMVKKLLRTCMFRLNTGVWQADGHTSCHGIVHAVHTRCAVRMKKMHWTDSEFDRTYFLYNIYLFSDYKKIHWTDFHKIWFGSILPDLITFSKFCINLLTVTFGVLLHDIPGNQYVN